MTERKNTIDWDQIEKQRQKMMRDLRVSTGRFIYVSWDDAARALGYGELQIHEKDEREPAKL